MPAVAHALDPPGEAGARIAVPMLDEADRERARGLLGAEGERAFEEGAAPLLLRSFDGPVAAALVAERAPSYVTLLHGLLRMRRAHELEPLHDDLHHRVGGAMRGLEPEWDGDAFAHDLEQLEGWGCVERRVEALRIRGYKDNRRQRFRWRLTEDAVALLEWLEARLVARIEGRVRDSRDLLTDVLGHLTELLRLLERIRRGELDGEAARRAIYLLDAVDDVVHAITEELLGFRAAMVGFASRPYDLETLRGILDWLDRYVRLYLSRVEELRGEIDRRLDKVAQPRYRAALISCREALEKERARAPRALGGGALRDTDALIDAQRPFFVDGGRLAELCNRIDDSAREVLRKMHRHLRELERRSARLEDLRARIREVAAMPEDGPSEPFADLLRRIVASAHGRFAGRREVSAGGRIAPPLPRRQARRTQGWTTSRPPRAKQGSPEAARALLRRRLAELDRWLAEDVAPGGGPVRLSEVAPLGPEAPRRWMEVARARWLAGGRDLRRLGWSVEEEGGAPVSLGDGEREALMAPEATVAREGR